MIDSRPLAPADEARLADVLAAAFRDNPLNRAVIRGDADRRLRVNRAGMRATLVAMRGQGTVLVAASADGAPSGGLLGIQPGVWPLAPPPLREQLRLLVGQGFATARRWGEVFEALRLLHPREPHAYLALVGVRPEAQGRGLGRALLTHWLAAVDRAPAPAYLETDRAELVAFYGSFGFRELGSETLFGVRVWRLLRPPSVR